MSPKIIFIDTETTGAEEEDRICQVAFKVRGEGSGVSELFKPDIPIKIEAMAVTGITNRHVENAEKFKKGNVMYDHLKKEFEDDNTIIVAHNASFDINFFEKDGLPYPRKHICTYKIAHHHDKKGELGKHTLQYLRYYHDLQFEEEINPHDALSDVLVLEKLFEVYAEVYTLDEMVEISNRPILLKKMTFGKYRDKGFDYILRNDPSYFDWLRRDVDMDEHLAYTVNYWINKK